jgi:hypothetical protein
MMSKQHDRLRSKTPIKATLNRRDFIRLGLAGAAVSCFESGCETKSPAVPLHHSDEVYELTDGRTLYDDFDGTGVSRHAAIRAGRTRADEFLIVDSSEERRLSVLERRGF